MALHGTPTLIPGSIKAKIDKKYDRTSNRTYRCYFDPTDSEITVMGSLPAGLALYSRDPSYAGFVVVDVQVGDEPETCQWPSTDGGDDMTAVRIWHAEVTYGPFSPLLSSTTGNPVDQPPRYRFASTRGAKVVDADINGDPIVNSAGDAFDPPIERNSTLTVLAVARNEANPDFPTILGSWVDHVNEKEWNGFPERTLLVSPVSLPDREYSQEADQLYYPMEYQFEFNPDTWDKKILDQGYREFDTTNSTGTDGDGNPIYPLRNIMVEGQPASEPVLLDGAGHALKPPVNKKDVAYRTVQVYPTLDFGVFDMDNLLASSNAPPATPAPAGGDGSS